MKVPSPSFMSTTTSSVGPPVLAIGHRQVGLAVAEIARDDRVGHAGDRQADRRRRLERAVAVAHGDRDAVGRAEGDGHVELVIVVEIADGDRRWTWAGSTSGGSAVGA